MKMSLVGVIVFYSGKSGGLQTETAVKENPVKLKRVRLETEMPEAPVQLKTKCCEKYLKGKRCKRCPCFDLN